MELVTKRDMDDARKILDVVANAEDGTPIRDFVHDVAQAIADGRRPTEAKQDQMKRIMASGSQ